MKSKTWSPIALFVAFLGLYHSTLAHSFSYDGVSYALDVEFGSWQQLFHPNHLLYAFFYRQLYHVAQIFGYHGRAILLMESANAIVGAAAVALLARILSQGTNNAVGSLAAILFGVSQAFWSEAIDPGCYALAALGAVLLLNLLFDRDAGHPFRTGLLHGFMVLLHQMLILVVPAFLKAWTIQKKIKENIWPYLGGLFVGAGVPYALAAHVIQGGSWRQELSWILTPAGTPPSGAVVSGFWWHWNFFANLYASWDSLVEGLTVWRPWGGLVVAIVLAMVTVWSVQEFIKKSLRWPDVAAAWAWILTLSLFQFFFFHATRYTILFMPPLLFLLAAATKDFDSRVAQSVVGVAVLLVAISTYVQAIAPRKAWGADLARIQWIEARLHSKDFLLFQGRGDRSIRNVDKAYFAPEIPARSIFGYLLDQYAQPKTQLDGLTRYVKETRKRGGRIWVEKELLNPRRQGDIEAETRIVKGSLRKWFKQYRSGQKIVGPDSYVLVEIKPAFHTE